MKYIFSLQVLLIVFVNTAYSQSSITQTVVLTGHVTDTSIKQPVAYVNVSLWKQDTIVAVTLSDEEGYYRFPSLINGVYDIKYTVAGYHNQIIKAKKISGKNVVQNIIMVVDQAQLDEIRVKWSNPLRDPSEKP